jgi:2'-5' RNA ligase
LDAPSRGRQLVVVALPSDNDPVRKHSSEKEPHLTLLNLGDADLTPSELSNALLYIGFAASQLHEFSLDVEKRGELGDKKADVLFFRTKWTPEIVSFRDHLLKNEFINRAYLSTEQFPEWIPHLTMGYPETPAKLDPEYDIFYTVRFDRIALWTEDYEGPSFQLKSYEHDMEVSMSNIQQGKDKAAGILKHYGVKGMKWGVRRSESESSASSDPDAPDVAAVKSTKEKIEKNAGKTDSISNKELQNLVNRMNLEQQYSKIKKNQTALDKGHKRVKEILEKSDTLIRIYNQVNTPAGQAAIAFLRKTLVGI